MVAERLTVPVRLRLPIGRAAGGGTGRRWPPGPPAGPCIDSVALLVAGEERLGSCPRD
jgi:hypothetical protein